MTSPMSGLDSLGIDDYDEILSSSFVEDKTPNFNANKSATSTNERKASRHAAGGWTSSAKSRNSAKPEKFSRSLSDDDDLEIPMIPDIEDAIEEEFTQQVAQAPSVTVNRVATYKELDKDLLSHAAFSTLDDIDLRLLTNSLANEADVKEPDIEWPWETIFTEVSSELLNEWHPSSDVSSPTSREGSATG